MALTGTNWKNYINTPIAKDNDGEWLKARQTVGSSDSDNHWICRITGDEAEGNHYKIIMGLHLGASRRFGTQVSYDGGGTWNWLVSPSYVDLVAGPRGGAMHGAFNTNSWICMHPGFEIGLPTTTEPSAGEEFVFEVTNVGNIRKIGPKKYIDGISCFAQVPFLAGDANDGITYTKPFTLDTSRSVTVIINATGTYPLADISQPFGNYGITSTMEYSLDNEFWEDNPGGGMAVGMHDDHDITGADYPFIPHVFHPGEISTATPVSPYFRIKLDFKNTTGTEKQIGASQYLQIVLFYH